MPDSDCEPKVASTERNPPRVTIEEPSESVIVGAEPETQTWRAPPPDVVFALNRQALRALKVLVVLLLAGPSIGICAGIFLRSLLVVTTGFAAPLLIWPLWAANFFHGASDADLVVSENPENDSEALVEIIIEVNGVALGRDRGVVWLEENALHFHGHRSSFRIPRQQALDKPKSGVSEMLVVNRSYWDFKNGDDWFRVGFRGLVRSRNTGHPIGNRKIDKVMVEFRESGDSQLEVQLPPLLLDREFKGFRWHVFAMLTFLYVYEIGAYLMMRGAGDVGPLHVVIVAIAPIIILVNMAPLLRGAAIRWAIRRRTTSPQSQV